MEKLPPNFENKIFYYLSHPIADLLRTQRVVLLKPVMSQFFSFEYTDCMAIFFSPEKIGLERIKEKGLYRLHRIVDHNLRVTSQEVISSGFQSYSIKKVLNEKRACYGSSVFFMYQFIRKNFNNNLMIKNKKKIDKMLQSFSICLYSRSLCFSDHIPDTFLFLSIDEFRTSCINCHTLERQREHFKYKDAVNKTRSLHSVLTYKMENNRLGCINRDLNAVRNIKYIYNYYLDYLRGINTDKRPFIFSRENKNL